MEACGHFWHLGEPPQSCKAAIRRAELVRETSIESSRRGDGRFMEGKEISDGSPSLD